MTKTKIKPKTDPLDVLKNNKVILINISIDLVFLLKLRDMLGMNNSNMLMAEISPLIKF